MRPKLISATRTTVTRNPPLRSDVEFLPTPEIEVGDSIAYFRYALPAYDRRTAIRPKSIEVHLFADDMTTPPVRTVDQVVQSTNNYGLTQIAEPTGVLGDDLPDEVVSVAINTSAMFTGTLTSANVIAYAVAMYPD